MGAIAAILDTLKPVDEHNQGGKVLIYVWALEQKNSRRGWDAGDERDVMVPWITNGTKGQPTAGSAGNVATFHRYYHLYQSGELEKDIVEANGRVLESGYEKDNWWAIAVRNSLS